MPCSPSKHISFWRTQTPSHLWVLKSRREEIYKYSVTNNTQCFTLSMEINFKCQESSHQHHLFLKVSFSGLLPPPANTQWWICLPECGHKPLSQRQSPELQSASAPHLVLCLPPLWHLEAAGANSSLPVAAAWGPWNAPPVLYSVFPSGNLPGGTEGSSSSLKKVRKRITNSSCTHTGPTFWWLSSLCTCLLWVQILFSLQTEDVHLQRLDETFQTAHSIDQELTVLPQNICFSWTNYLILDRASDVLAHRLF